VRSQGTREFWALYRALSPESRSKARKAFLLFAENPDHPSLRFKKLHGAHLYWSVRFGSGTAQSVGETAIWADWIWIGTHQDFDKAF
jgi:hypothetical protein